MSKKILYVFRGQLAQRILNKKKGEGPYEFLYGLNLLKNSFACDFIVAPRGKRSRLIEKLFFILEKPFNLLTKLGLPLGIYPLFKKKLKQADIIFCPNETIGFGVLFYKMLGLVKAKAIILIMSLPERLKYFKKNQPLIKFITKLLSYTDIVLTLSDHAQKPLVNSFNLNPNKLKTFYFGVDIDYWKPNPNIKKKDFVLSVGNDMNRDFDTLIKATPKNLDLIIVSLKKINVYGKPNIKILSQISDKRLKKLYQSSALTVIPSIKLEYESSGLSCALQAMACGSPVIIPAAATMQELFVKNIHCSFYKPQDSNSLRKKMLELIKNEKLRKNLSMRALQIVKEKHTAKKMAKQIKYQIKSLF